MNATRTRLPLSIPALALTASLVQMAPMSAQADSLEGYARPGLSPQVTAHAMAGIPYKVVTFGDLNLSRPEGIKTLHARIMSAVNSVCPRADNRDLRGLRIEARCREEAIAGANAQVEALIAAWKASGAEAEALAAR
jgi:UrcA family protein